MLNKAKGRWLLAIGVFWALYVIYAWTTPLSQISSNDQQKAALIRIGIASFWFLLAAVLLLRRSQEARLVSFLAAALILVPPLLFAWIAFEGSKWPWGFLGMAVSYTTINGLLCLTIQTAWRAGLVGLLIVTAQVVVDAVLHLFAGTLRFH